MKIDIDDALVARNNELLTKLIEDSKSEGETLDELGRWAELKEVQQKIIDVVTGAYVNRGNDNG